MALIFTGQVMLVNIDNELTVIKYRKCFQFLISTIRKVRVDVLKSDLIWGRVYFTLGG